MDFGRLANVDDVDFDLPSIDVGDALATSPRGAPCIRLGAPAWAKRGWVGRVYPEGTEASGYLAAYGATYGAVELNATLYRTPTQAEAIGWASSTPADFRFAPKLQRSLVPGRPGPDTEKELARFGAFLEGLGDKRGPSLLSMPPSFSLRDFDALKRFLERWPTHAPLAIELRHPSWFSSGALDPSASAELRARRVTAVVTDVAGRRDVAHGSVTTSTLFVRFVGNALHASDFTRIDAWALRLRDLIEKGLEEAYFFIHEPDDDTTPELLAYAAERFGAATQCVVRAGRPKGQMSMF